VSKYIQAAFPDEQTYFRVITLAEPLKAAMMAFLDAEHSPSPAVPPPTRAATVQVFIGAKRDSARFFEIKVNVRTGEILHQEQLLGRHPHVDGNDMVVNERACLSDPRVQAAIKEMTLPEGAEIRIEPWTYATDGANDMTQKITMCYFYMKLNPHLDANHYAYPLSLCVELSSTAEVLRIYHVPISGTANEPSTTATPYDYTAVHGSEVEYHPDLLPPPRSTTKPYHVSQPEGPSFTTQGNLITWEKWRMRISFNYREGLVLHDVRYDSHSLFYRLSLSEMFVPYGDPRSPFVRKAAFDLGNDGAGANANNLKLGCDCLGHIKYFDGYHVTSHGDPIKIPNAVCLHEIDDGILWKHTNFRTGNAVVARSRRLVLQTIITVSNYEYIFAWYFGQDASLEYEVRATGIVSTVPIAQGEKVGWGTNVARGVMAPSHQHLFCLRVDPSVGGWRNSLCVEESVPMGFEEGKEAVDGVFNPFGVGYTTTSKIVEEECGLDLDHTKNRTFKIINENIINPVTGTPVGYKLSPHYSQGLLAHPSSYHAKRSEFGAHSVWVTRYGDDEIFASGKHTMQSHGGEGIASWIKSRQFRNVTANGHSNTNGTTANGPALTPNPSTSVRNTDIVLWHTFGSTHNPRIEDWPVMPCEKMSVGLKPCNFFSRNPGMDVMPSSQERNRSVLVDGNTGQEKGEILVNGHP
jgi:primary-amine oxidase